MSAQLMTNTKGGNDDRLIELLAGEALADLSPEEQRELDTLVTGLDDADRTCMQRTAAALTLTEPEPLPAGLADTLLADLHQQPLAGPQAFVESKGAQSDALAPDAAPSFLALAGWLAAAAALVAAFVIAIVRPSVPTPLTAEQRYQAFLDTRPADTVEYEWMNVMEQGITGRIVWSDEAQEGYMVFQGMDANDPKVSQYQLWIFDEERDQAHPVDGGIFDIADAGGETVVPIDAKIPVLDAAWFAVTVERPGGVVVSDRESIPVVANMPS